MYFLGDLHGNSSHLLYTLAKLKKKGLNIIQVGDFGIGFNDDKIDHRNLDYINKALIEWESNLYIIRGNHDNPKYFKGAYVEEINTYYSNIHFVEDYEVLEIEGKKILCVGGGISIDRTYRINGKTYWPDEEVVYNPFKIKEILNKYDEEEIEILVTHSSPMWCPPVGIDAPIVREYCMIDETLKEDLIEERDVLSVIFHEFNNKFKFKHHFYGHFHRNERVKIDGTTHVLIGIGDFINYDKLLDLEKEEDEKLTKDIENKQKD